MPLYCGLSAACCVPLRRRDWTHVDVGPEVLEVGEGRLLGLLDGNVNLLLGGLVDSLGCQLEAPEQGQELHTFKLFSSVAPHSKIYFFKPAMASRSDRTC